MLKTIRVIAWTAVLVLVASLIFFYFGPDKKPMSPQASTFSLQTVKGETFESTALSGKPYAVFFGFTHCPDICPTTLTEMTQWINALGGKADDMRYLYITVDPERDTTQHLAGYLDNFAPQIIGLTGTIEQISTVQSIYNIYAKKVDLDDGEYTMDHTASVLLYDKNGQMQGTIAYGEKAETAVKKLENLLMR